MKRLSVLIALFTLAFSLYAATLNVVQPFYGNDDAPVNVYCCSSYSQQIYHKSQINHQGEILKLRFMVDTSFATGSLNNSQIWRIYLGHTTRNAFGSLTDWEPAASLTEVFWGPAPINLPPGGHEWIEFILDTSFAYNNVDNLVIAVYASNYSRAGTLSWSGDDSGASRTLCYGDYENYDININAPPTASERKYFVPALQLVFPDTEVPVAPWLRAPNNNATLVNGQPLDWRITHNSWSQFPPGQPDASGYDVYINGELVSENQPENRYFINGLEAGRHSWHVVARNNIGFSPPSETRYFKVESGVAIGDRSEDYGLPIAASQDYTYSQSIILQSEVDIEDQRIEKISYLWNGGLPTYSSNHWEIYMGHSDKTEFSDGTDWVPESEMELVFDGHVEITRNYGWVEIELDYPFLYNNTDNLVIAVHEKAANKDLYYSGIFYGTPTPGQHRSIVKHSDMIIDPSTAIEGSLIEGRPNILMRFGQRPAEPIFQVVPTALDYEQIMNGEPNTLSVRVTNMGGGVINLSLADLSFVGPNADEFTLDPANLPAQLGPMQYVHIPVSVRGVTTGPISAALRFVVEGEYHDVDLAAEVMPTNVVVIGDGTQSQFAPLILAPGVYRSYAFYTADQISGIGNIDMIAWDCVAASNEPTFYVIRAKNTNEDNFKPISWLTYTEDMTVLRVGRYDGSSLGWQMFEPYRPFVYTGGNLIIGVETDYPFGDSSDAHNMFRYTDSGELNHQTWRPANNQYGGRASTDSKVPNIMLHFSGGAENDICVLGINGPLAAAVGRASRYTVRIRNNGINAQANYQVKLMGPNDTELAAVNGPPVDSDAFAEVVLPWTPATSGTIAIYAKVEMAGDELVQNNLSDPITVDVPPEGTQAVTIGKGDRLEYMPMNFHNDSSFCQSLYLAEELGFVSGTISSLVLYNQFYANLHDKHTIIYLGSTYQNDLNAGFIPASELTLVYDGEIDYPVGTNNIHINFQTPYVHTGGNLVMLFYRPYDSSDYDADLRFRIQIAGDNRTRLATRKYGDLDPFNPPNNTTLTGKFPQVSFFYSEDPYENELAALSITGDSSATVGSVSNYTVSIKNYGSVDQTNYTVKLMGPDEVVLASVDGPPISSMQSLDVVLPWTPATVGSQVIHAKVELAGDEFTANNLTRGLEITVFPVGTAEVNVEVNKGNDAVIISWAGSKGLAGYTVYRLQAGQEQNEAAWTELPPEPGDAFKVIDTDWLTLPDGDYRWAVKTVYSDGVASLPRISGILTNEVQTGKIVGVVKTKTNLAIAGATVSNGRLSATTNSLGEYILMVPVGSRTLEVTAEGFDSATVENVMVSQGLFTSLNLIMLEGSGDPEVPVAATALHGNYPNPFNPKTTISYSVKQSGKVCLNIYNIKGQLVRTLLNEHRDTGHHESFFDGEDDCGRALASGVYFVKMNAPGYRKVIKIMLMK